MKRVHYKYAALAGLLVTVAACDNRVDQPAAPPPPPPPPVGVVDQLGAGFATTFRAGSMTEPRNPAEGDIVPVTSARDPINF